MIQDLNDLSVLGKNNTAPLEAINFALEKLEEAANASDELANILALAVVKGRSLFYVSCRVSARPADGSPVQPGFLASCQKFTRPAEDNAVLQLNITSLLSREGIPTRREASPARWKGKNTRREASPIGRT